MVERPDEDASAAEIAEWMEQDFWDGVGDSIREAVEDSENES